ncbi:Crp/Fnr family transcriptional regulator [Pedobacter cryoconitis]|uniref:CRP-like cAMP-binding protein n=1 Tax=Pedobacter cryoconitis TaxID=188932 RepID=A0A327STB8_9SPHI|nr:Crp/Fnr family transcriptional regulator [Pedobacter cryoconitis]RAJ32201.1 CRP-like cAMP-binding protein [Pedobacter cryoconitis]
MLRTNADLLAFTERLYTSQERKEDIILRSFNKGERLLEQDIKIGKVFILSEGIAKCYLTEENDKDYLFEFLGKGQIIGEIEALKNSTCLCTVEAIIAVKAYCLSASFFMSLVDKNLEMNKILLQELSDRLLNTSSRASFQQLYSLEHGLSKLLQLQKEEEIELSRDDMAAYLGITIRSLNRALKQLKKT